MGRDSHRGVNEWGNLPGQIVAIALAAVGVLAIFLAGVLLVQLIRGR
jgi:hypothetical protein